VGRGRRGADAVPTGAQRCSTLSVQRSCIHALSIARPRPWRIPAVQCLAVYGYVQAVASCSASIHIEARVNVECLQNAIACHEGSSLQISICDIRRVDSGSLQDCFNVQHTLIQSRRVHILPSLDPGQKSVILRCERTDGCWTGPWCLSESVGG
jgi:hypothetical protein